MDPGKGIILTTPALGVVRSLPGHIQPELVYRHPRIPDAEGSIPVTPHFHSDEFFLLPSD